LLSASFRLYAHLLREISIPQDKVLFYFNQILDGVEAAHLQQVIHRDLKPENILYDEKQDLLLIADFGIAHFEEEALYTSVETSPNTRLANFQYAAPEQRNRGAIVDHSADIYALGLILNEMFTGQVPHGTGYKTIGSVASGYEYLDEIVSVMLRQSAEERPSSIDVIKCELIGRKQEFITRQRISELKQTVVPITDIDDSLIIDPPRLINVDIKAERLILFLQQSVSAKWIRAWEKVTIFAPINHLLGARPDDFTFELDRAILDIRDYYGVQQESNIQRMINDFKTWLPIASRIYAETIQKENKAQEDIKRKQLQEEIEDQERRLRILSNIKI
jgi:serine/threonine protein kinase